MADLKPVYRAVSKEVVEYQLDQLQEKMGEEISSCYRFLALNWDEHTTYSNSEVIRKLIYTTNIIKELHLHVRKVTEKGTFTWDMALLKLIYLTAKHPEGT